MRVKKHKLFWIWDFEREEEWLNEMAAKGLNLVSVDFCTYHFETGTPGEYAVRLEMLNEWPGSPEGQQYIRFIEDTGAQNLGSLLRWVYFRKRVSDGPFDLFSDIDSRIRHLSRILWLNALLCALMFFNFCNMMRLYYEEGGEYSLLVFGILCGLVFLLAAYGFGRVLSKSRKLKKERELYE